MHNTASMYQVWYKKWFRRYEASHWPWCSRELLNLSHNAVAYITMPRQVEKKNCSNSEAGNKVLFWGSETFTLTLTLRKAIHFLHATLAGDNVPLHKVWLHEHIAIITNLCKRLTHNKHITNRCKLMLQISRLQLLQTCVKHRVTHQHKANLHNKKATKQHKQGLSPCVTKYPSLCA